MSLSLRAFQPVLKQGPLTLHAAQEPSRWVRSRPALVVVCGPTSPHCVWEPWVDYFADRLTLAVLEDATGGDEPSAPLVTWADERQSAAKSIAGVLLASSPTVVSAAWSLGVTTSVALSQALDPARALQVWLAPVAWPPATVSKLRSVVDGAMLAQGETWFGRLGALLGTETLPRPLLEAVRSMSASLDAGAWAKRFGLVHRALDTRRFSELAAALGAVPRASWLPLLDEALALRPLERAVSLGIPTLVLSGDRDPVGLRQVRQYWGATTSPLETMLVRGAGHLLPLEFPELIQLRVEKFLRDRGVIALSSAPQSSTMGGLTA